LAAERVVSTEEGKQLANYMNARFVEITARQANAVTELFESLVLTIEKANSDESPVKEKSCVVS
jgi:hypothetical protein